MFARNYGHKLIPLYVGKSVNLRTRISQQLTGNVKLMNKVQSAGRGNRVLLVGEFIPKQKQSIDQVIRRVEKAFIEEALNNNPYLINEKGTKDPSYNITSTGNRTSTRLFGKS